MPWRVSTSSLRFLSPGSAHDPSPEGPRARHFRTTKVTVRATGLQRRIRSEIAAVADPLAGLQIADTSFYYPEDRGISESIKYAKRMVAALEGAPTR
jgi:hypothetical protein